MHHMAKFLATCVVMQMACFQYAWADVALPLAYLRVEQPRPPTLSNLDAVPDDIGLAGARTGLDDNITTGRFLGHGYTLTDATVAPGEDPLAGASRLLPNPIRWNRTAGTRGVASLMRSRSRRPTSSSPPSV